MHPEVLHDLRNPLRKLVTTPSLIAYSRHRCLLISTTWSTSKNDFWTPRLVLIHSEFVHPWDEVFRQSLVIPDYKYKPHVVLFLRCFQDFSSECIDAYMSGNLDLEQLLIIMYITGWDQHVLILFLWGCWKGLCQHAETAGREMPQKMWMLNDAGSQAFCLQLRPPLHVLGLGSWYVQAGLL